MKTQTKIILAILISICIACDLSYGIYESMTTKQNMLMDIQSKDVEYHIPSEEINNSAPQGSWLQKKGKLKFYTWSDMFSAPYNKKGLYKYGNRSYVPSYEDSIYLSHYRKRLQNETKAN
jgi:hypothetical protein